MSSRILLRRLRKTPVLSGLERENCDLIGLHDLHNEEGANRKLNYRQKQENFLLSKAPRPALGPNQSAIQCPRERFSSDYTYNFIAKLRKLMRHNYTIGVEISILGKWLWPGGLFLHISACRDSNHISYSP